MNLEPRVFHLHSSAGVYGAEYVLLGLVPALARAGVPNTLLCLDSPLQMAQPLFERARTLGILAERIPCRGKLDWSTVHTLRKRIMRENQPILHVHGYKSAFYAWLTLRGTRPVVATLHGPTPISTRLRIYNRIEQWLLRRFDRVCVVSARMREDLIAAGVREERIRLVENGIDTDRFRPDVAPLPRSGFGIPEAAFVFGASMRLSEEKNPLGLLDAFATVSEQNPAVWLAIAGDGPLRAEVTRHAERLGIAARVRLLGARDDMERYYPMLDCFVLPSHYEGLPLALLEAMAAARPVVSTNVGQVSAVLAGLPAHLVPPADVPALASAMQACVRRNPFPGLDLRQRVCERYSAGRMAQAYADVYRDLWRTHGYVFA
ncbi:MAG: glycosyltransferase [Proteobacteria bacterium]|nr:glycosyltransferase [Pseudomonadota bacterium]